MAYVPGLPEQQVSWSFSGFALLYPYCTGDNILLRQSMAVRQPYQCQAKLRPEDRDGEQTAWL